MLTVRVKVLMAKLAVAVMFAVTLVSVRAAMVELLSLQSTKWYPRPGTAVTSVPSAP
jgi:hypothetical protein